VPLFEGIYSDLFPGVALPHPDCDELVNSLKECIAQRNLQTTPWFMEKIIQIYEMILIRHGLMIVGLPMCGKTCSYQVQCLLVRLHHDTKNQGYCFDGSVLLHERDLLMSKAGDKACG
jgi:hypothetical protein